MNFILFYDILISIKLTKIIFHCYYRLLKEKLFPSDNVIPYLCKKAHDILKDVGVEYNSYHGFINDCIMYR